MVLSEAKNSDSSDPTGRVFPLHPLSYSENSVLSKGECLVIYIYCFTQVRDAGHPSLLLKPARDFIRGHWGGLSERGSEVRGWFG